MEDLIRKQDQLAKICADLDEIELRNALREIDVKPKNVTVDGFLGKTTAHLFDERKCIENYWAGMEFNLYHEVEIAVLREAAIRWTECMRLGQS